MSELRQRLDERGGHLTQQRLAVYEYVAQAKDHPTAEEVYLAVKAQLPRLGLATVYKNLEALVACGLISKLTYGDASARYDRRTDHHFHTRCLKCGQVEDLEAGEHLELLRRIKPQAGFAVADYRLELVGQCRTCR